MNQLKNVVGGICGMLLLASGAQARESVNNDCIRYPDEIRQLCADIEQTRLGASAANRDLLEEVIQEGCRSIPERQEKGALRVGYVASAPIWLGIQERYLPLMDGAATRDQAKAIAKLYNDAQLLFWRTATFSTCGETDGASAASAR